MSSVALISRSDQKLETPAKITGRAQWQKKAEGDHLCVYATEPIDATLLILLGPLLLFDRPEMIYSTTC